MTFSQADFDYYERTVSIMYRKYFTKRITIALVAALIIALYTGVVREHFLLNGLLIAILVAIGVYYIRQARRFPEVYRQLLAENQPDVQIRSVVEDEYSYNIYEAQKLVARINKAGVRNLPSQNKQYTLMVGFDKRFFAQDPLKMTYYDMLDLTYEEKFRLSRGGYSNMPRFLRRFTWRNLKASAGNAVSFLLSNLFFLFILYRLIRYVIAMLRMLF